MPRRLSLAALFAVTPLVLAAAAPPETRAAGAAGAPTSAPAAPESAPASALATAADFEAALAADAAARAGSGAGAGAAPAAASGDPFRMPSLTLTSGPLSISVSLTADVAFAWFNREPLQTGEHDPNGNGFHLQQLELNLSGAVDPYFRLDTFLVLSGHGIEVEEAFGTTLSLPWNLQLRAGLFLTRFGRINATHPHAWDFVDQPLAIGRVFGGEGNRGLGVEASWLTPLPWFVELIGAVNTASGEETARSFIAADDVLSGGPLDFQLTLTIEQFFALHDDLSLVVDVSVANGPNATFEGNRTDLYALAVYLKYRRGADPLRRYFTFSSEWFIRRRQIVGDLLTDMTGYAAVAWRFAHRWSVAARWEYGSAPYDLADMRVADDLDPLWDGDRHRISVAGTFWPTEFSRLRLQIGADVAAWMDGPGLSVMLALELNIGAHGAHKF